VYACSGILYWHVLVIEDYETHSTTKRLCSDEGSDFSKMHLVTCFYSGSSMISPNQSSLLWPSVTMALGDITSSPIATVTIR
jgi:hypothetical protein